MSIMFYHNILYQKGLFFGFRLKLFWNEGPKRQKKVFSPDNKLAIRVTVHGVTHSLWGSCTK